MKKFNLLCEQILREYMPESDIDTTTNTQNVIGKFEISDYVLTIIDIDGKYYYQLFQDDEKLLNSDFAQKPSDTIKDAIYNGVVFLFDWSDYIAEEYELGQVIADAEATIIK